MTQRFEIPIKNDLATELFEFWHRIFGGVDPDIPIEVFLGGESDHTRLICYLERDSEDLMGTCGIAISTDMPHFAGLGEVATEPRYRGRGIASRLSTQALEEFVDQGGEALFLGTGNPDAARIYHRLGWRRIAGANVWANIISGDSPEEYLVDYFRTPSPVTVAVGDPSLRVPMVPLLLTPHDWQVLDGNIFDPMLSIRYAIQDSCMGLYRKYYYLVQRDDSEWFVAKTSDNRLVGISTAHVDETGTCWVDGFVHARFIDSCATMLRAAMDWGVNHGADGLASRLSVEDEDKQELFRSLGFRVGPPGRPFQVGDRQIPSLTMTLQ